MKSEGSKTTPVKSVEAKNDRFFVVRDLVNVTWRMLTPTILGIVVGMVADSLLRTAPIGFVVGAFAGLVIGIMLTIRVIKRVRELES